MLGTVCVDAFCRLTILGPSAGITMATSLLSLALDRALDPTIAMTGELTVTGKVLRIGGLREKTVAARRAGAKTIIFPNDNMSDWLELPEVSSSTFFKFAFHADVLQEHQGGA